MKKKLCAMILGVAMSTLLTTMAIAEDVYVTKYGKKYHKAGSRFIKNKEVEKITREEAEERGLKPSSDFLKEEESAQKPNETK